MLITEKNKSKRIEYNAAGALLLTLFGSDFTHLMRELYLSGYDTACLLPFRALENEHIVESLPHSRVKIAHIEEAWNPTHEPGFLSAVTAALFHKKRILDIFRLKKEPEPTMYWDALFPSKDTADSIFTQMLVLLPDVKFISHTIHVQLEPKHWLLEIHPGLKMDPHQILEWSDEHDVKLVFDPSHLLESENTISRPKQPTSKQILWEKQFLRFRRRLEVVDFKGDLEGLSNGKGMLAELASAAKRTPGVDTLRVEIPVPTAQQIPLWRSSQKRGMEFLAEIAVGLRSAH